ncbi:50S ribosomal protein L15 [Candidatus Pacearchaeota archaeon CG10_big_fil_rev_8_21_14_0_10_30_48]|nr:MAG: 50S ribosomal protein L15 [Candidatus Pacearchaeota archaeon CG10_big_fil_rev_8_21_14_0_10_30_48]
MKSTNKKRKKVSRMRGSKTHGTGGMKKARGSGHRGGVGMAGTGKRADQRKSFVLNLKDKYFGKEGLKGKPKNYDVLNVSELERLAKGNKELKLNKYKILGNGEIKTPLTIHAKSASKMAIEKIKKAGGKVIIEDGNESSRIDEAPSRS